eukprot:2040258-Amphidinium_carterae.1
MLHATRNKENKQKKQQVDLVIAPFGPSGHCAKYALLCVLKRFTRYDDQVPTDTIKVKEKKTDEGKVALHRPAESMNIDHELGEALFQKIAVASPKRNDYDMINARSLEMTNHILDFQRTGPTTE